MDIKKGNKIIAKWMGGIYSSHAKAWGFDNAKVVANQKIRGKIYKNLVWAKRFEEELKYHNDWNWLMPVVKKIEQYEYPETHEEYIGGPLVHDCAYMRTFHGNMARINRYPLHHGNTQIEAVWEACVEFIESINPK